MTPTEQISRLKTALVSIEKVLLEHGEEIEKHAPFLSFVTNKPCLFINAGPTPIHVAKLFGNKVKVDGEDWLIELPDFDLCFRDAVPRRPQPKEITL